MKNTAFRRAAALALAAGLALAPLSAPASAYAAADDGAVESAEESAATEASGQVTMYRLYNKWSGEHLYTSSAAEIKKLVSLGWRNEGTAWVAPASSKTPVYRLYNPYSGDHHYTTDSKEYAACAKAGWRKEGVAWYSDDNKGTALLRGYNPYVSVGTHHYTTDSSEMSTMKSNGWRAEGVAWYGLKASAGSSSSGGSSAAGGDASSGATSGEAARALWRTCDGRTFASEAEAREHALSLGLYVEEVGRDVTYWKTSDGQRFGSREEAEAHAEGLKVGVEAYTETVHHDAVTHDEVTFTYSAGEPWDKYYRDDFETLEDAEWYWHRMPIEHEDCTFSTGAMSTAHYTTVVDKEAWDEDVTRYRTTDGETFGSEAEARAHAEERNKAATAVEREDVRVVEGYRAPDGEEFASWDEAYRHSIAVSRA